MVRKLALLALAGLLAWPALGLGQAAGDKKAADQPDDKKAEEIKKWTGFWGIKHAKYDEVWKVSEKDGMWAVEGAFLNDKSVPIGIFYASDVKMANNVLTFTRDWAKKPTVGDHEDTVKFTAVLSGENLQFTTNSTKNAGKHSMLRLAKPPLLVSEQMYLVGAWTGHIFSIEEKVIIQNTGSTWKVDFIYTKGVVPVGAAVGLNPQINAEGKLVFQQKFIQKPDKGWHDGNIVTAHTKGDGKLHMHWTHLTGGSGGRGYSLVPGTGLKLPQQPVDV